MNARMLELARQAGLKKDHGSDREYLGDFDWREFADLIAKECMACSRWVGTVNKHPGEPIHIAMAINKRITQQLGVK
jgi:hypothetical protein